MFNENNIFLHAVAKKLNQYEPSNVKQLSVEST